MPMDLKKFLEGQSQLETEETNFTEAVLIDTDAVVALMNEHDANHQKAMEAANSLVKSSLLFIISNHVFGESLTVISKRIGHKEAVRYLHQVGNGLFEILRVNERLENLAFTIFEAQTSKNVSFIDCTNMAILTRYRWDTIFSFDRVYPKNGFRLVTS